MASDDSLRCEVENAEHEDPQGNKVTTVKCHGRLVSDTTEQLKEVVKPLLPLGGRIIVDLGGVDYLDSSGLGALVALKVSAIRQGLCILEFANMTPRIVQLLRISNLTQMFSSSAN